MKRFAYRSLLLTTLGASLLAGVASCSKDKDFGPDTAYSAEDNSDAEGADAAAYEYVDANAPDDVNRSASGTYAPAADLAAIGNGCATRTYDAATHTLTISFDPAGCTGRDGRVRRGQIVAVFSGQHRQAGSSVVVSLVNYSVNGNAHTGTRTITYLGNGTYTLDVQAASVTTAQGTFTWASQRTYTQTAGQATRTILDDEYSVTGSASGTNRKGVSFTATIQQPLKKVFQRGCARLFTAGTVEINTSKEKTLLLNYDPTGTAACDNIASITVNGRTRTIRIR
ncbi:hypothetical protein LJ737_01535 [Hymenobacter sp. 15J16-1T3B]|uniref:hypothetical protein n=1 Tax=Hymenobacter sp. 15J16-1T3B TaxID=2886941 RepID=UPI001D12B4DB|nr:hypothetical protein [Hymenobacter sp. 15J16-1T3B]MCC3155900.1 hypothetical protein [Hymenobacter sp. 15J16-1T3B]